MNNRFPDIAANFRKTLGRTRVFSPAWIALSASVFFAIASIFSVAPVSGEPSKHRYVGLRKCAGCHSKKTLGDQRAVWEKGPHVKALKTLETPQSAAIAQKLGIEGPANEAPECLRCHVTAFGLPEKDFAYKLKPEHGVQCESCHGPGRDYRKKTVMSDPELAAEKGLWDSKDPSICTQCHNAESPTFDPTRFQRADGTTAAFDFEVARDQILHPIPEHVKGRYLEIEERLKAEGKKPE